MKKLIIIFFIFVIFGFSLQTQAEDTNLRLTLNVNAYGRSVNVTVNGIEIKKVTGGHAQAIQLYHEKHPLSKDAPKDYKDNFCLKQGKNIIKIVHRVKEEEMLTTLDISILAIGYDIPLIKYIQKPEIKTGEASGVFELFSK